MIILIGSKTCTSYQQIKKYKQDTNKGVQDRRHEKHKQRHHLCVYDPSGPDLLTRFEFELQNCSCHSSHKHTVYNRMKFHPPWPWVTVQKREQRAQYTIKNM